MKTPIKVLDAMNSLTENDEWGDDNQMLEETLSPDDWRLQTILKYRAETNKHEREKEKQAVRKVHNYFKKNNINNPYIQANILDKLGAKRSAIMRVTKLNRQEYFEHVKKINDSNAKQGRLPILDVVAMLRTIDLHKLLKSVNYQKGSIKMLKIILCTLLGALFAYFYMAGQYVIGNWIGVLWIAVVTTEKSDFEFLIKKLK